MSSALSLSERINILANAKSIVAQALADGRAAILPKSAPVTMAYIANAKDQSVKEARRLSKIAIKLSSKLTNVDEEEILNGSRMPDIIAARWIAIIAVLSLRRFSRKAISEALDVNHCTIRNIETHMPPHPRWSQAEIEIIKKVSERVAEAAK